MQAIKDNEFLSLFSTNARPYGVSYAEWTARWWQWALSSPKDTNPVWDTTGQNSSVGQSGPVWFLAGTFGGKVERTCEIPAGRAILFPISNHESSFLEFPDLKTELELRDYSKADIDKVTTLIVTIDDRRLGDADLKSYRVQSPLFELDIPENNVYGLRAGATSAVSDGFWIFLKPLVDGEHEIYFMGSCRTDALRTEVRYHINIKRY